jgi:serine/threonine protein kinase
MNDILKTGACSIVIGKNHYQGFFPEKANKLIKVTKILGNHNELKNLKAIKKIRNYQKYFTIPDENITVILPNSNFYQHLVRITQNEDIKISNESLFVFYIDFAGEYDVLDSIDNLNINRYSNIWNSSKAILRFSKHMIEALNYLHLNKICHLDIKPENIMINSKDNSFKMIDFGFSSIEPFNDYVFNLKGTPTYFPKYYPNLEQPGLPKIEANDMILVNGFLPMITNRKLVYKIDSYCLGRVINLINYYYLDISDIGCFCYSTENKNQKKIRKIIKLLLENDVNLRLIPGEILYLNIFK